jgi:ATP-binding cassette subfamily B protein
MLRILRYIKPVEWLMAGISLVFIVGQVWLELKLPDYMAEITRLVQTPGSDMADIWYHGGYMLLCALGSLVSAVVVGFFASRIGASFSRRLRSMLFDKVGSFSMEEIDRFSTSSLITRSTNDITQVQMIIVMGMQVAFRAPIMAVWAVTKIAGKGVEWSMATGCGVLLISIVVVFMMIAVVPKFRKMQVLTDNITRVTRENLTGLRVVRAYNAEGYQEAKFSKANDELTGTQLFTNRAMVVVMPVMMLMMSGLTLSIYWIGAYMIDSAEVFDKLTVFSNMVVFSQYAMQVIMSFMMLVMIFIMGPRAAVSAKRINEVLDTQPKITDGAESEGLPGVVGEVEFRGVSFRYPDGAENVLHDVSFTARKGETVAFIGSTGSGKTKLVNLIPRFFDAAEGEVLVDGVNVKDYKQEALLNKIGYVPQKAVLFKGTIGSNVAFGERGARDSVTQAPEPQSPESAGEVATGAVGVDASAFTDDDIKWAVEIAQGKDFVETMENQYEASVAQGGTNLSGGQKQRVAIARAVCRKPELYIFDDSFSALDYKTDSVLRKALRSSTAGITSLIVAQRIGTIMDADQIIVLDEGRVVGKGTHRELLDGCEVYKEIALSQLSEEELV